MTSNLALPKTCQGTWSPVYHKPQSCNLSRAQNAPSPLYMIVQPMLLLLPPPRLRDLQRLSDGGPGDSWKIPHCLTSPRPEHCMTLVWQMSSMERWMKSTIGHSTRRAPPPRRGALASCAPHLWSLPCHYCCSSFLCCPMPSQPVGWTPWTRPCRRPALAYSPRRTVGSSAFRRSSKDAGGQVTFTTHHLLHNTISVS